MSKLTIRKLTKILKNTIKHYDAGANGWMTTFQGITLHSALDINTAKTAILNRENYLNRKEAVSQIVDMIERWDKNNVKSTS